jgi:hypothetical protein
MSSWSPRVGRHVTYYEGSGPVTGDVYVDVYGDVYVGTANAGRLRPRSATITAVIDATTINLRVGHSLTLTSQVQASSRVQGGWLRSGR